MTTKLMIVLSIGLALIGVIRLSKSSGKVFDALADIKNEVNNAETKEDVINAYYRLTRVTVKGWHKGHSNEARKIYNLIQKKYNENLNSM